MRLPLAVKDKQIAASTTVGVESGMVEGTPKSYRIRVIERHDTGATAADWLKVVPPTTAKAPPSRIVRQFDERHGVAVHTFFYSDPDEESLALLNASGIGVLLRPAVLSGAVPVPPVDVRITSGGELLPLASGGINAGPLSSQGRVSAP